jgi:hypothetical protein
MNTFIALAGKNKKACRRMDIGTAGNQILVNLAFSG